MTVMMGLLHMDAALFKKHKLKPYKEASVAWL